MLRVIVAIAWLASAAHAAPLFDREIAPPRALVNLRAGMALDDARDALAGFARDESYRDAVSRTRLVRDAGGGAQYYVLVHANTIARIGIEVPKPGLIEKLARLWGKPAQATNLASEMLTSWITPAWRVDLACRGERCRIAYHRPLDAAFFGAAAAPPGPLATLRPWMQHAEIATLVPRFATGGELPAGPEDVRLALDFDREGRLRSVLVSGLPAGARGVLERAWGPRDAAGIWWNPDGGWRAILDEGLHALQLFPYVPAGRLLGPGPGIAALPRPILGATRDQLAKVYPTPLTLPPTEDGVGPIPVGIDFDANGHANRVTIALPCATSARKDELIKLLEAKWGAAKRTKQGRAFSAAPLTIEVREEPDALVIVLRL
jgi:hypothetical protein